ncbi:hypothetical protein GYM62_11880 [Algoriphagus sp. NBT04N3]|jgi:hypothetical protein|uniref:hypothetical protein n=1 Tax=Algoriphagus sp. NBT04N3 TaxID=2705473 RepID=UPI001C63034A|nr:hypothetical protein [Algoriphagus sp. NBT04N3]QYH39447.1 hypothetical protein GYM62_11880 [Algoriphagus sp. NBT04N3]
MGKRKKAIQEWREYRLSILEQKAKSDDDFEKYITFISSGALIITLTFVEKISPLDQSTNKWILIAGWGFLASTLLINLLSHYLSSRFNEMTIQNLDEGMVYEKLTCKIKERNKVISVLNIISIISLGIGIASILVFAAINAYNHG